jgi:hypothetical protein
MGRRHFESELGAALPYYERSGRGHVLGFDNWVQPLVAMTAALAAGAANAIAGGGTIISFPVLVWLGLPPVQANATNAVGLWMGSVGGALSYRERLSTLERRWIWMAFPALLGGGVGAWLLLSLPPDWFDRIGPLMVIGASALVALEPLIRRRILSFWSQGGSGGRGYALVGVLLVSMYGGYFGAGIGILLLVSLALMGLDNLHQANALKNLLVVGIKGVAVAYFIVIGALHWPSALIMVVGSTLGGWTGGFLIREVQPETLRWTIVAVGAAMGTVMVVRTYF